MLGSLRLIFGKPATFQVTANAALRQRWYSAADSLASAQTLSVRKRIEDKRRRAVLGGGQARIDAQHKKVGTQCLSLVKTKINKNKWT